MDAHNGRLILFCAMPAEPLRLVCGNPNCKAGLLIKNAETLTNAKCPRCGYINPLPPAPVVGPNNADATMLFGRMAVPSQPLQSNTLGWLIVKDELTDTQTFTLQLGANTIGRQSARRPATHVIVTRDEYMSRPHCTIEVRMGKLGPEYILQDGALIDGIWKNSLNGTYLNGNEPRLSQYDQFFLEDGDTIQIGETKLVLKAGTSVASQKQAAQAVEAMDYERTVVSFKRQTNP